MGYPPQGAASPALTATRAGYIDELAAANLPADIDALTVAVETVDTVVDAIRVVTDATPVLEETGGTISSDETEQNVYINNAPEGVYVPEYVAIDFTNNTAAQSAVIRQYRRYKDGGDWIKIDESDPIVDLPDPAGVDIELKPNRFGIKVTLQVTGATKNYDWTVFYRATS